MNIKNFSNKELLTNIQNFRRDERRLLRNILEHICEVETRKLHIEIGYPTVFEWLVKDLGYSESSAYRRMMAARALSVESNVGPEVAEDIARKIEDGRLNLVSLAKVQSAIRNEERRKGEKISSEAKSALINRTENKTTREAEKIIALEFPESTNLNFDGRDGAARLRAVQLNEQAIQDLERVRELKSHSNFGASLEDIIAILAKNYLDKNDPLRHEVKPRSVKKKTLGDQNLTELPTDNRNATVKKHGVRRPLPSSMTNFVRRRASDACEYQSEIGHRCGSRFQTEIDHIKPVALGGSNDVENLRVLCRVHNGWMAERQNEERR